jgi:hypothetical protein
MRKRSRLLSVAFTQFALLVALIVLPTAGQSTSPTPPEPPASPPYTVLNWIPHVSEYCPNCGLAAGTTLDSLNQNGLLVSGTKASGTVPMWLCSSGTQCAGTGYEFAMVGNDPTAKNGSAVTITTRIVPLRVSSGATVFDPENNDSCSPSKTPALNMVQNSPMFLHMSNATLPSPLKPLGPGQYASLFQRASFWTYINPKATSPKPINPGYQVNFQEVLSNAEERDAYTIQIIDPSIAIDPTMPYQINGNVQQQTGWCNPIAVIEVNQLDNLLQNTIIPKLKTTSDVTPTNLPIFLLANVAMYDSTLAGQPCCILGYHNAYLSETTGATANKLQTYIVVNYDSTNCPTCTKTTYADAFPTAPDIAALSMVLPGWIDNPTTLNVTPNWSGTINGVTQCQTALEVGFPSGLQSAMLLQAITMPSKVVYHVQDLAFKSWFYRDGVLPNTTPNSSFNTLYSLFGSVGFHVPAPPC